MNNRVLLLYTWFGIEESRKDDEEEEDASQIKLECVCE